jgi:hypothetical protein
MASVEQAMQEAEDRKNSVFGEISGYAIDHPDRARARLMFMGFDVDLDELHETSTRVAAFFGPLTQVQGSVELFKGCWVDGLLTGLLLAQQLHEPIEGRDG